MLQCRTLREICQLYSDTHHPQPFLTREKLEYLACIARNIPDKWVCLACTKLHPISEDDRPSNPPSAAPCRILNWYESYKLHDHHGFRLYALSHRHVQLALKYTRMGDMAPKRYQSYLEKLLEPHHTLFFTHPGFLTVKDEFWATPKVLNGRFLLKSRWDYARSSSSETLLSSERIGFLHVCAHQFVYHPGRHCVHWLARIFGWLGRHQTMLQHILTGVCTLCHLLNSTAEDSARRARLVERTRPPTHRGLCQALGEALKATGSPEVSGSCHLCPTDFTVQMCSGGIRVHAWKDLGPECSPLNAAWKANVVGLWSADQHWRILKHEPGSVRKLYEGL